MGTCGWSRWALAGREEKEPARLRRGLKPGFRPDVITGNHGASFLSKGVVAGRGSGVGDRLRKGTDEDGLLHKLLHTPMTDV